jgi:hypothetical protein
MTNLEITLLFNMVNIPLTQIEQSCYDYYHKMLKSHYLEEEMAKRKKFMIKCGYIDTLKKIKSSDGLLFTNNNDKHINSVLPSNIIFNDKKITVTNISFNTDIINSMYEIRRICEHDNFFQSSYEEKFRMLLSNCVVTSKFNSFDVSDSFEINELIAKLLTTHINHTIWLAMDNAMRDVLLIKAIEFYNTNNLLQAASILHGTKIGVNIGIFFDHFVATSKVETTNEHNIVIFDAKIKMLKDGKYNDVNLYSDSTKGWNIGTHRQKKIIQYKNKVRSSTPLF